MKRPRMPAKQGLRQRITPRPAKKAAARPKKAAARPTNPRRKPSKRQLNLDLPPARRLRPAKGKTMTKKAKHPESAEPMPPDQAEAQADAAPPPDLAARDRAVRDQIADFVANLPPGAESGLYSAMASDRWSSAPALTEIPDGTYQVVGQEWIVTFRAGRLYAAQHASRAGDATITLIDG
jgi:transposase InsO family protein